jgi:thiol-disulfide isomerase/thioredoxin
MIFELEYIGAKWCGPCKQVKPAVTSMATKYSIPLTIFDYDTDTDKMDMDEVKKLPTIRIKKDGKITEVITTNHIAVLESFLTSEISLNTNDTDF